jgi:thymidine kinase
MAKLYFKYGAMGSSKTANALITKFNYEERGMKVWLIKPSTDNRDGAAVVRSRIGLSAEAYVVTPEVDLFEEFAVLQQQLQIGFGINTPTIHIGVDATKSHGLEILFVTHKGHAEDHFMGFLKLRNQFPTEAVEHIGMICDNENFHFLSSCPFNGQIIPWV